MRSLALSTKDNTVFRY